MAQAASRKSNGTSSNASYEDLAEQIATLRADLAGLTETLGKVGRSEKERLVSAARSRGEDLKAAGEARLHDAGEYLREQPATALGLAAALGFLAGYILTGRR